MPLIIDGGRVPTRWAEKKSSLPAELHEHYERSGCVKVALINNMPDAALEDTELQFFELLDAASDDLPVLLKLYSLTGVPRSERGKPHLNEFYFGIDDLWNSPFDAIIMTGAEPRQLNLRDEPYWSEMVDVLEWAERNTISSVLSCLAAHVSVLHSDGIDRHPLADKQSGVFDFAKSNDHVLTSGTPQRVRFPHSRWNEVRADALAASGYLVLTQSAEAGVDSFVKKKKESLFVHFQGHPEYGTQTLLKEYRRDIRRFLHGERETYPSMPKGYFDASATRLLTDFQTAVMSDRQEERMAAFPESAVEGVQNTWQSSATSVYRKWLQYMAATKTETAACAAMPALHSFPQRKQSAV